MCVIRRKEFERLDIQNFRLAQQFSGVKVVVQTRAKKLSITGVTVHLGIARLYE
jgi:hypothetical protein